MQLPNASKVEIKTLIRSVKSAFEKVSASAPDGTTYVYNAGVTLSAPLRKLTSSEVKSYLSALDKIVQKFPDKALLTAQIDIVDDNSIAERIAYATKENFEASKKIAGKAGEIAVPGK